MYEALAETRGSEGHLIRFIHKPIGVWPLGLMIFWWVAGSPFGIEVAVRNGGPILTLIFLVGLCVLWAFPQALVSAELSLMVPVNGGSIIWVQRAFGFTIGLLNAYINVAASLVSATMLSYLLYINLPFVPTSFPHLRPLFIIIPTIAAAIINIFGVNPLSHIFLVSLIVVYLPFFIQLFLTFFYHIPLTFPQDPAALFPDTTTMSHADWTFFIGTMLWCTGGLEAVGSVAGEVAGEKYTFIWGVVIAFPLIIFNYAYPVIITFAISPDFRNWTDNHFQETASHRFPPWFGMIMSLSAAVANFGQICIFIASVSRSVWVMAKGDEDFVAQYRYLPHFFSYLYKRNQSDLGTPIVAIVAVSLIIFSLSFISFPALIETTVLAQLLNLFFVYSALIKLRYSEPETPRPFIVPGGKVGVWLLMVPTLILGGFFIYHLISYGHHLLSTD